MRPFVLRVLIVLSVLVGGGSLVLFTWFLLFGPPVRLDLLRSDAARLGWDAGLCLLFFAQHSGMVRRGVKRRLSRTVPEMYGPAAYSIVSGLALAALVFLWQPAGRVLVDFGGPARWASGAVVLAALAGFLWAARSLRAFDPLGTLPLRAALRDAPAPAPRFVVRGPYRLVRHPIYLLFLVLIWSSPRLTADRLLFNVLWTLWIVLATRLEERDLVAEVGEPYRDYQRAVPMLVPRPGIGRRRERGLDGGPRIQ